MASQAATFKSFAVALVAVLFFFAAAVSAQGSATAPAPGPSAGAADGTLSSSLAIVGASVVLSMLAIFRD